MEHETRLELAQIGVLAGAEVQDARWPSLVGPATRCSLIARSSPSRWQRVAILEFIDVYEVYRA